RRRRGRKRRRRSGCNACRRRIAVWRERRKHHAWRAVIGIDVNRLFLARHDFLGAIADRHAIGRFARAVRRRRYHLGRRIVGLDDRRVAALRPAEIGAVGERRTRADDSKRKHRGNRQQAAGTLANGLLGFLLVAVLVGVGIVGIGRVALIVLRATLKLPIKRLVIARGIGALLGLLIALLLRIILVLRRRQRTAAQGMDRARSVLLRRNVALRHGARVRALHPGGWTGRRPRRFVLDRIFVLRFFVWRRLVASARRGRRRRVRLAHGA